MVLTLKTGSGSTERELEAQVLLFPSTMRVVGWMLNGCWHVMLKRKKVSFALLHSSDARAQKAAREASHSIEE